MVLDKTKTINSDSNPFPGLRAFKGSESHLFFGREENISDVLTKLDKSHFVAVVGTSGTGKSSLIKAGVLPAIRNQENNQWKILSINPGSSPIENLANAVCQNDSLVPNTSVEEFKSNLLDLMHESSLGLVQAMRPIIKEGEKLLILVDQFEEVFRFASEESPEKKGEYDKFVKLIIDTIRQRDVPIYAVLTLRSDFLGDCVAFEGLPEAINDGHYLVPRMTKTQLKRAITGPIDYSNGKISPRLIRHITEDLGSSSDQLPILQHAMMRCWNYWVANELSGEPMDLMHFAAIGDLDNALSDHANEAFAELDTKEQSTLEKVLKALTSKKADNRGVRRPMSLENLIKVTRRSREEILSSIAPFQKHGRSFILPSQELNPALTTIYDISHESLMRGWNRLTAWVDEEMKSGEFYNRICTSALLHKDGASALWRNPELQFAIDWKEKQDPIEAWGQLYNPNFNEGMSFVEASKEADIIERNKKRKRTKLIRLSLFLFFLTIMGLAGWALVQTNIAKQKTNESVEKSNEAIAQRKLAESAKSEAQQAFLDAEDSKELAEKEALNAHKQEIIAKNQSKIAGVEKQKAVTAAELAIKKQNLADQKSVEANNQRKLAIKASYEATRLRLIAIGQNIANTSSQITQNSELASLLAIQSYDFLIANNGNYNASNLYASATKALSDIDPTFTPTVMTHPEEILSFTVSGNQLNFVDRKGQKSTINVEPLKALSKTSLNQESHNINTVYMGSVSNPITIGLSSKKIAVYNPGDSQPKMILEGHTGLVRSVVFRSSEPKIVSGGRDSTLILWNSNGSKKTIRLDARIKTISLSTNEATCLVGCENGSTYVVTLSSQTHQRFASQPDARVEAVSQSKSGNTIAIAYSNGLSMVYDKSGKQLKKLSGVGKPVGIIVDENNDVVIVASSARIIRLYSLSNLDLLPIEINVTRQIKSIQLNPLTLNLIVYCSDRTFYMYPIKVTALINSLKSNVTRSLTQEEWSTFIGQDVPYLSTEPKKISEPK